ncbi:MAG: hypothetical protein IT450_04265 [Phycisphaerales bacterium]|nr:hypothetical protein [Phycisphaerales bacterium]
MNVFATQLLAALMATPMPGPGAPVLQAGGTDAGSALNAAFDPLYFADRLPGVGTDVPQVPGPNDGSGEGSGPRGNCAACNNDDAAREQEPDCAIPTDTRNGGCNSNPPVYTRLNCGDALCGSGATDGEVRDTDWWRFQLEERSIVHLTVEADFLVQVGIADLSNGCPIPALSCGVFGDACTPTRVSITLSPGTYAAFVAPQFIAPVSCGERYRGTLECIPCPCAGDFNGDGAVSLADLALLLSSYGGSPSNPCMDSDYDGLIGLQDLASFLPEFGNLCP